MEETLKSLAAQLPDYLIRIGGVIAIFIVGRWIAARMGAALRATLEKRRFDPTLARFFGTIIRSLVLVVVALACLSIFGIETTSVAAVIGAAALAIGLALQGSLGNFAAGVMLIIFRPYRVGDTVTVDGTTGTVFEIGLFSTVLDTPDRVRLYVPNTSVYSGTVKNMTHHEVRRADVSVGVDYSADIDATRAILTSCIADVALRLEGQPHTVYLTGLGASSVDWQVRVWCKTSDYWACLEQVVRAVKVALDAAGIGIPFPQMDVHLDGTLAGAQPAQPASTGVTARAEM